jgi:hypothetical protein
VHSDHRRLGRYRLARDQRPGASRGRHHVPDAVAHHLVDRAEPPILDRLVARRDPGTVAEHFPPGGEHVGGGTRLGVDVPGARLAAQQRDSLPQLRDRVDVDPVVRADVDHAVVGGHVQHRAHGQRRGDLLRQPVHVRELVGPRGRRDPVLVAGYVEVGGVHGDQDRLAVLERVHRLRRERPQGARRAEVSAPERGTGQAGCLVRPVGDVEHAHARRAGTLEDRRLGLPAHRVDVLRPVQPVQQPALAGNGDLQAEHAMFAGHERGAKGGQAGHRRRREAAGHWPGIEGKLGQERRGGLMGAQLLPAHAVHDEQADPPGRGQAEYVGAPGRGGLAQRCQQ